MSTNLNKRQQIAAEMLGVGHRTNIVASHLGVRKETITRWKQLPGFEEHCLKTHRELCRDLISERLSLINKCHEVVSEALSSGSDNKQIKAGVAIRYLKSVNGAVTAYSLLERQSRSINEETEEEKAFENICRTLDILAGIRASNHTLNDAEFRMFVTEALGKL
jgi:hypothetical protein